MLAALPALADQPPTPKTEAKPATPPPAPSAAVPVDHQTYKRSTEAKLQEWKTKLDGFVNKARSTGNAAATASNGKLQEAWAKVKAAKDGLETAGSDTWEGARHAYEASSNDLVSTWYNARKSL